MNTKTGKKDLFDRLGLPRAPNKPYETRALLVAASVWMVVFLLATARVISWDTFRAVNLIILFLGGGLRLLAHNQDSDKWRAIDGAGKVVAYYGAFGALATLST